MKNRLLLLLLPSFLAACGPSSGGGGGEMAIREVGNGFGRLLPHEVFKADAQGNPTSTLLAIQSLDDIVENVKPGNKIHQPAVWEEEAVLPNDDEGNHFVYVEFTQPIDVASVLDANGLKGSVSIVGVDGLTGATELVSGRAFVGGMAFEDGVLQPLVIDNGDPADGLVLLNPTFLEQIPGFDLFTHPAEGFPGSVPPPVDVGGKTLPAPGVTSSTAFFGADVLVSPNVLVFIADTDGTIESYETFPNPPDGMQIRIRITTQVLAANGKNVLQTGVASSTVGADTVRPEVALLANGDLVASPSNGAINVDPSTEITLQFTEPIQLQTISVLEGQGFPGLSSSIQLSFGPDLAKVTVPFTARLLSPLDLTSLVLTPAYELPANGPGSAPCTNFNRVEIGVFLNQIEDLAGQKNQLGGTSHFFTGQGTGIVNAPVTPDAIYVARFGGTPSLSIVDLNGFGASTGNPTYDIQQKIKQGNTNYPNNPNVVQGAFMFPVLQAGTCTFNGGSEGVFTLTKSSALSDRLVTSPVIESISDMMLGHALDSTFNNGPPPFGCQAGGGNPCAFTGFKSIAANFFGANTLAPTFSGQFGGTSVPGGENLSCWAPHPNPPPLIYPPLCLSPFIAGQEPTSIDVAGSPTVPSGLINLLNPGSNPLGNPGLGQPPSTLLAREQNGFFEGPSSPVAAVSNACSVYQMRQQVGHFMYLVDRVRREVVVLNSNRMTVLDRIPMSDPTSLAISPNLDLLAVTNQSSGIVSFIDINPTSSNFHTIIKETDVGLAPRGIAWEPHNEDVLVCNEGDDSVSIISAFNLEVRKTLQNQLNGPFELAITPRQSGFGFNRNVYLAYILNRDGTVSIFESGPNGLNGWGYDEVILQTPFIFKNPKALQPDHLKLNSGVWIVHEDQLNSLGQPTGLKGGAVSNLVLTSANAGQQPLPQGAVDPNARDMAWEVRASIGSNTLTGVPVDIAFDNQMNLTGLINLSNPFSAGSPAQINAKGLVRSAGGNNVNEPLFMFLAVPNSQQGGGVIDVISLNALTTRIDTNVFQAGIQSIPAQGAEIVMDFFRQ